MNIAQQSHKICIVLYIDYDEPHPKTWLYTMPSIQSV